MGPLLCYLCTADLLKSDESLAATFVDDTVVLASYKNENFVLQILQDHLHNIEQWFNKWRIRASETN